MSRFRVAAHDRFSFVCRYDYVLIVGDHSKQIHCKYINHIIDGHHIALFDHIISYPVDYEVLFFNSIRLEQTDYPVCIPYGRDLGSCHYDSPVSSSYGVLKALFYTGRAVNDYVVILVSYLVYELDDLFRADRCLIPGLRARQQVQIVVVPRLYKSLLISAVSLYYIYQIIDYAVFQAKHNIQVSETYICIYHHHSVPEGRKTGSYVRRCGRLANSAFS